MADGNFITNQKLPGKKNGSEQDVRNDRIVFPPRSAPDPGFVSLPHFSKTNKTKTSKVYPKYWPTKTEPFGSTSISLYGLWALNNQADTPLSKAQRQLTVPYYSLTPGHGIRIPYTGTHAKQSTRNSYAVQQHAHGINNIANTLNIANRTEKSTPGSAK
jgi:hypothetical protein